MPFLGYNKNLRNRISLVVDTQLQPAGKQLVIHVPYADSFVVHAYVWKASVGRIPLYLLDTDNELNSEFDRPITCLLYTSNRKRTGYLIGYSARKTRQKDTIALFFVTICLYG